MTQTHDLYKLSSRAAYLIVGFIRERLTTQEHDELDAWVEASDENMQLFEEFTDERNSEQNLKALKLLYAPGLSPLPKRIFAFRRERLLSGIYIATIISGVLIGIFFLYDHIYSGNILPPDSTAILELADGSMVDITSADDGLITTENGTIVKKTSTGDLLYDNGKTTTKSFLLNKLSTLKASQYTVVLPDGSKVFLNAVSSLRYPTQFSGDERQVELSGEAYFEVATKVGSGGNKQPFIVKLNNGGIIKTVDAHFNVSSYQDESYARVTVLQGNAEIAKDRDTLQLHPAQAGLVSDSLKLVNNADSNEAMAWKNGYFLFRDANIETIMREMDRWYNIHISEEPGITGHFNVSAPRNVPLSRILHLLEATGQVRFKTKGRKISVSR